MTKPKNKAEALQREVEELKTLKDFQAANIRTLSELVQRTERDSQGHKESATAFRLKSESLEAELASVRRILSEKNKAFDERNGEAGRAEEVARTLAAKINDVADILAKIASGEGFYGTMALVQKAAAEALAALAQRGSYTEHLPF